MVSGTSFFIILQVPGAGTSGGKGCELAAKPALHGQFPGEEHCSGAVSVHVCLSRSEVSTLGTSAQGAFSNANHRPLAVVPQQPSALSQRALSAWIVP